MWWRVMAVLIRQSFSISVMGLVGLPPAARSTQTRIIPSLVNLGDVDGDGDLDVVTGNDAQVNQACDSETTVQAFLRAQMSARTRAASGLRPWAISTPTAFWTFLAGNYSSGGILRAQRRHRQRIQCFSCKSGCRTIPTCALLCWGTSTGTVRWMRSPAMQRKAAMALNKRVGQFWCSGSPCIPTGVFAIQVGRPRRRRRSGPGVGSTANATNQIPFNPDLTESTAAAGLSGATESAPGSEVQLLSSSA